MFRALTGLAIVAALAGSVSSGWSAPPAHYRVDAVWGDYGSADGEFYSPMRLNILGSRLLVADRDNHRIQMFTLEGVFVRKYGCYGRGVNNLSSPFEADFAANGDVFISDWNNGRVVIRSAALAYKGQFGSQGSGSTQLMGSRGLAVDRQQGWVYVADTLNHRICKWTTGGVHMFNFGTQGTGPGEFNQPFDVAVGADGIYVADTENSRIQEFDSDGAFIRQWDGSAGGGRLDWPPALTVAPNGNVFVCDGNNNRVVQYTADGQFLNDFGGSGVLPGQFDMPAGVAVDSQLRVYVADGHHHRLERFRLNSLPTAPSRLTITPKPYSDNTDLIGHASGSTDADGDTVVYCYRWYESADNAAWSLVRNARVLPASLTTAGRWYRFQARAWDGYDYGPWVESAAVRVSAS